jgi:DNA-binding transcriptional LysR family regulator
MTAAPVPSAIPQLDESHLRLLRIFRAVAEAGGLTAAESKLSMERSTISRHLQALEVKLGATLCYRGPTGFELTEFGRTALQVAVAAGEVLDTVRDELNRARNAVSGDLHLGIADTCLTNPRCAVFRAVTAFSAQAPSAVLHLSVHTPDELLRGLRERRLHIGITGTVLGNADLRQQTLFPEQFRLYVGLPAGGEVPAPAQLRARNYALVTRENDYRTLNLAKRLKLDRHAVAMGLEAVATLIAGGGFVGYLPTHYVAALAGLHRFTEVRDSDSFGYETKFAMAMVQRHRLPPAGHLLAKLLQEAHAA